jgi:hypothetical protein
MHLLISLFGSLATLSIISVAIIIVSHTVRERSVPRSTIVLTRFLILVASLSLLVMLVLSITLGLSG